MKWYYAEGGKQIGPVEESALDDLVRQGIVRDDTLVWREGMAAWQRHAAVRGSTNPAPPLSSSPSLPMNNGPSLHASSCQAPDQGNHSFSGVLQGSPEILRETLDLVRQRG